MTPFMIKVDEANSVDNLSTAAPKTGKLSKARTRHRGRNRHVMSAPRVGRRPCSRWLFQMHRTRIDLDPEQTVGLLPQVLTIMKLRLAVELVRREIQIAV